MLSAAKQLNTEMKELAKDLSAISRLNKDIRAIIHCAFDSSVDWDGDAILNLSHLLGLMLTYECSMILAHIPHSTHRIPILSHFRRALNAIEISESTRHEIDAHCERCKQQHPIVLYYGASDDTFAFASDANGAIWHECKRRRVRRCPLRKVVSPTVFPVAGHVKTQTPTTSRKPIMHGAGHNETLHIPVECLSPLHTKKYHQFGRQHKLPVYSKLEVSQHKSRDSCWIIVNGLVLDVTGFLPHHPASAECILKRAGGDASRDFHFHSKKAQDLFMKFVIGRVQKETACVIQ